MPPNQAAENITAGTATASVIGSVSVTEAVSSEKNIEQDNYVQVENKELQGRWITVSELESFDLQEIKRWIDEESSTFQHYDDLELNYIDFYYGGTYYAYYLWHSEKGKWSYDGIEYETADYNTDMLSYYIYRIEGEDYLFLQKKNEDGCFILKKNVRDYVSPQDQSRVASYIYDIADTDESGNITYYTHLTDEYKFISDKDLVGEWIGVDYIDTFDMSWLYDKNKNTDDIWYKKIEFRDDGSCTYYLGENMEQAEHQWTYGLIVMNSNTDVRKYLIYNINGEDYLFIENMIGNPAILNAYECGYYIFKRV